MRAHRAITAIIAFALIGLTPLVGGTAGATSSEPSASVVESTSPSSQRQVREVTAKIVNRGNKLFMQGAVKPNDRRRTVLLSKSTKGNEAKGNYEFKNFAREKVNQNGRYRFRVFAPRRGEWFWQTEAGNVKSEVWKTFRTFG